MTNALRAALGHLILAPSLNDLRKAYRTFTDASLGLTAAELETVATVFGECMYHFQRAERDHAKA